MLRCREDGPILTVVYRPRVVGVIAVALFALGVVLFAVGATQPHDVRLRCAAASCALERVGVLSSERVAVTNLRRAETTPEELVLRADPDVVMGPWVARRGVPSYRAAEAEINRYLDSGRSGTLDVGVPVRGALRWLGFAAVALVLGLAFGAVYAIGARAVIDRERDEIRRFGSRLRAKVSAVTGIEVKGNQIIASVRDGRPIAIVSALGPRDLDAVATRIRGFVLS